MEVGYQFLLAQGNESIPPSISSLLQQKQKTISALFSFLLYVLKGLALLIIITKICDKNSL